MKAVREKIRCYRTLDRRKKAFLQYVGSKDRNIPKQLNPFSSRRVGRFNLKPSKGANYKTGVPSKTSIHIPRRKKGKSRFQRRFTRFG